MQKERAIQLEAGYVVVIGGSRGIGLAAARMSQGSITVTSRSLSSRPCPGTAMLTATLSPWKPWRHAPAQRQGDALASPVSRHRRVRFRRNVRSASC